MGLEGELRARGARFGGILNGLDQALWDPATDATIAAPYDAADRARQGGLPGRPLRPRRPRPRRSRARSWAWSAGSIPRRASISWPARRPPSPPAGARIVALGSGDASLVAGMRAAAATRRGGSRWSSASTATSPRRIYAGADLFLMPSRFEPCGQGQMIAMRYGTPPVARRTGGLADTIVDLHEDPGDRHRLPVRRADARRPPRSPASGRSLSGATPTDPLGGPGPARHGGRLGLGALVGARLRRALPAGDRGAAGRPGGG